MKKFQTVALIIVCVLIIAGVAAGGIALAKHMTKPEVQYVDVQINVYDKDEEGNYLETTHALETDEENVATFTFDNEKLAVPTVEGVSADKYEITYLKLNADTEEFEEITEETFLNGSAGTYKFGLKFKDEAYAQVSENLVGLVIEPKKVNVVWPGM